MPPAKKSAAAKPAPAEPKPAAAEPEPAAKKPAAKKEPLKDPKGGLTDAGRQHAKETEGANPQPGVTGAADSPDKMKQKGSFLRRHFANPKNSPLTDEAGKPTRFALQARLWNEKIPKTAEDAAALVAKGERLLEKYKKAQDKAKAAKKAEAQAVKDQAKADKAAAKAGK